MPPQSDALGPGDCLDGRYELLRIIGSGGMGLVFAARRISLGDLVAIKGVHADHLNEVSRARFLREARAMARIRHPNVMQVFDYGDPQDAAPYLVMELVEGPTLSAVLRRQGRLPISRVLSIFGDLCAAIEAGHRRGVVHRDIKPGNILLSRDDDGGETLKVLDFGLARLVGEASGDDELKTQAGVLMGTSAYMSPEQIETSEAGTASDVFALGVLLYELATGELPFQGPNSVATIMRITAGVYRPPQELVPELPAAVVEAIVSCLQRDQAARPGSARELARMLDLGRAVSTWRPDHEEAPRTSTGTLTDAGLPPEYTRAIHDGGVETKANAILESLNTGSTRGHLHGRRVEREALADALVAAVEGQRARVSLLTGDAGMGKSAVCEVYRQHALDEGARVFRARFYAYEGDRPPPNETFLWMLSAGEAESRDGLGAQQDQESSASGQGEDRWRAFEHIGQRFLAQAEAAPLVILFDDVQWATRLELDCVSYLLRALDGQAVHVVLTVRSDAARPDSQTEVSRWLTQLARQNPGVLGRVPLGPLSADALRRWLEDSYKGLRAQPSQFRRLRRSSGGNPHYFAELVRQLEAQGAIREDARGWLLDAPADMALPESVAQAVLANLAELSDEARKVAEVASVIGEEVRFETLLVATGLEEDALDEILEHREMQSALTEKGTSAGSDYRFASPTIRGVLYDAMSRRRRRKAHRCVVGALESLYSGDPTRIAKILCYHFEAIEDWERTLETGLVAAKSTLARFDADNAEVALRRVQRAIDALAEDGHRVDPQVEGSVMFMRGTLYMRLGRHEEAERALRGAEKIAKLRGDVSARAEILLELGACEMGRGRLEAAADLCTQARTLATSLADIGRELRWRASVRVAQKLARLARYEEAEECLREIFESEDEAYPRLRAEAHREQAWMEARRGHLEAAEEHGNHCMHLGETHRDPYARYLAASIKAIVTASRGEAAGAVELYEQAIDMARGLSLRRREMIEVANSAMAYLQLGKDDEALRRMLQTRALCVELGDRASEGDSLVGTGRVLVARGELDEAAETLSRGRSICEQTGRTEYAALATLELGLIEVERDDAVSAITLLESARTTFEASDSVFLWRVYHGLARALSQLPTRVEQSRSYAQKALVHLEVMLNQGHRSERERDSMREAVGSLSQMMG